MTWSRAFKNLTIGALVVVSGACVTTSGRVYLRLGPPAPVIERRIDAPGLGYVWQPGYYRWDGRGYVWVSGHYERAPRGRARWESGHWSHDRHGWYWVEGRWR